MSPIFLDLVPGHPAFCGCFGQSGPMQGESWKIAWGPMGQPWSVFKERIKPIPRPRGFSFSAAIAEMQGIKGETPRRVFENRRTSPT